MAHDSILKYFQQGKPQGGRMEDDAVRELFESLRIPHHYNRQNWDDEISGWMIGCLLALRRWSPGGDASIKTYASAICKNEAADAVLSFHREEVQANDTEPREDSPLSFRVALFVYSLNPNERKMARHIMEGRTIREISRIEKWTYRQTRTIYENIQKQGRDFFGNEED